MQRRVEAVPVPGTSLMEASICFRETADSLPWLCVPYRFSALDRAVDNQRIKTSATAATGNVAAMYVRLLTLRAALGALEASGRQPYGSLWREVDYTEIPNIAGGQVTHHWYQAEFDADPWFSDPTVISVTNDRETVDDILRQLAERSDYIVAVYDRRNEIADDLDIQLGVWSEIGGA